LEQPTKTRSHIQIDAKELTESINSDEKGKPKERRKSELVSEEDSYCTVSLDGSEQYVQSKSSKLVVISFSLLGK